MSFSKIFTGLLCASSMLVSANPLVSRQAQLPPDCTEQCYPGAGCLCLQRPTNCQAEYFVKPDENCGTIVARFNNLTATALFAWNPEITQTCAGLRAYVPVCIGVPGYKYEAIKGGDVKSAKDNPAPVQTIVPSCTKYEYTDKTGPSFAQLLSSNHITERQWNTWNWPDRQQNDTGAVFGGYYSCVAA